MPLYARLLISFLAAMLVPSIFVGVFSYSQMSRAIEAEVRSSVNQTIGQVNRNLSTYFNQAVELSTIAYINPEVQQIMGRKTPADWKELQNDIIELKSVISNITSYEKMYKIRFYYRDVGQYPEAFEVAELQNDKQLKQLQSYAEARTNMNGMQWTLDRLPASSSAGGEEAAAEAILIRVLRELSNNRELGALTISLPESKIWDLINDVKIGKTGYVFLIDNRGRVVSHFNKTLLGEDLSSKDYVQRILTGTVEGDFQIEIDGTTMQFVYQAINGTPWKLVGFVNTKELKSRLDGIKIAMIVSSFICFGLAIIYSIYTSGWFAKRIGNVIKAMRRLESGDLGTQLRQSYGKRRSNDEFTLLYDHFNRMSRELKQHVDTISETNAKIRAAELKALQTQINPHFLYNTLDAINWMAATKYKAMDISRMVTALAQLFRLSLNKDNEWTTVEHEIEHVKCYVTILKVRFDNEFELHVDIEQGLEQASMIKLILQPLVENAIIHGFEDINYSGLIELSVRRHANMLLIRVIDNGIGCDVALLNRLLDEPSGEFANEASEKSTRESGRGRASDTADRSGYGLRNVNERIKLFYGKSYGLQYENRKDGKSGTCVSVSLPIIALQRGEGVEDV